MLCVLAPSRRRIAALLCLSALPGSPLHAQDVQPTPESADRAFEQVLTASLGDNRGVRLLVNGQALDGVVVRIQTGQWIELRTPQQGRIVVRLARVDAVIRP